MITGARGAGSSRKQLRLRQSCCAMLPDMVRNIKTAIRLGLMAFVAYGIIYQFPC
jgi:hypothetical protein